MKIEIAIKRTDTPKPRPSEDSLGFGRFFSDHMFIVDYASPQGWTSPRIVPYQNLPIDPAAAALHYGQAIFEGLKAFRGVDGRVRLFRPEMNWRRMRASAERLCMSFIDLEVFVESLQELVRTDIDWVPKKPGTALYLRPTLIGSEAFLGVRPSEQFTYFVISSPVGGYYGEGSDSIKIWIEQKYARAARGGIGEAKAGGNYASSLLAAMEAKKRGYAQVLWLDASDKRFIEEVGTMNVFFRIGDEILTPNLNGTILPGVTRDSVLQILQTSAMKSRGVRVQERPIELAEVLEAHRKGDLKEVFGTGTAASISPVGVLGFGGELLTINGGRVGEISTELYREIVDIQYGRQKDPFGWTMEVPLADR